MTRRPAALAAALFAASAGLVVPPSLAEGKPKVRYHQNWAKRPSARYAAMSAARCKAELTARGVAFSPVERAPGVLAPVRLPEGVGGVIYRTEAPAHQRGHGPHDVVDCRLALALSDFSKILRAHGVSEVRMSSAWRPAPAAGRPGEPATRHAGALALDAHRFGKDPVGGGAARTWLDVEQDFGGALGAPVCESPGGAATGPPAAPAALELRALVCEAAAQHLFTVILTPNYDRAHKNHLHLEVTPGVQWELMR